MSHFSVGHLVGLIALVAMLLIGYALYCTANAIDARGWTATRGTITESEAVTTTYSGGRSGRRSSTSLHFSYRYYFDGKQYTGSKIGFGGLGQGSVIPEFLAEKYPSGSAVTVYVDPNSPQRAVLERDFPLTAALYFGVGVAMLCGTFGVAISTQKNRQAREYDHEAYLLDI